MSKSNNSISFFSIFSPISICLSSLVVVGFLTIEGIKTSNFEASETSSSSRHQAANLGHDYFRQVLPPTCPSHLLLKFLLRNAYSLPTVIAAGRAGGITIVNRSKDLTRMSNTRSNNLFLRLLREPFYQKNIVLEELLFQKINILSLTTQVPQSKAISHGTSNPILGITIMSPASQLGPPISRHTVTLSCVLTVSNKNNLYMYAVVPLLNLDLNQQVFGIFLDETSLDMIHHLNVS
ncbi:hypothetical protein AGLY_005467 [Aphis glycines]|uniref:Uncharacterized protein n=1 Tax=Aphis glycines TaxID=307491 RepID=A0A6G0TU22_APHGL|nr:hypothetical protein AGLY_005467 [Aphis glycines]